MSTVKIVQPWKGIDMTGSHQCVVFWQKERRMAKLLRREGELSLPTQRIAAHEQLFMYSAPAGLLLHSLHIPEQRPKSFLFKVPVIREHFGQALASHHLHRNTIRQTVTFVRTAIVER